MDIANSHAADAWLQCAAKVEILKTVRRLRQHDNMALDAFLDKPITGKQLLKVIEEKTGAAV